MWNLNQNCRLHTYSSFISTLIKIMNFSQWVSFLGNIQIQTLTYSCPLLQMQYYVLFRKDPWWLNVPNAPYVLLISPLGPYHSDWKTNWGSNMNNSFIWIYNGVTMLIWQLSRIFIMSMTFHNGLSSQVMHQSRWWSFMRPYIPVNQFVLACIIHWH